MGNRILDQGFERGEAWIPRSGRMPVTHIPRRGRPGSPFVRDPIPPCYTSDASVCNDSSLPTPFLTAEVGFPIVAPLGTSAALVFGTFCYGTFSPTSRLLAPVIIRGPQTGRRIAITFDDGPVREGTELILSILEQTKTPATFFFIGKNVERCPDLARRAVAEGHQIENHSFDHSRWGVMRNGEYWTDQWRLTDAAIAAAGGPAQTAYFRPPMGFKSRRMARAARIAGVRMVAWSLRGMDGVPTTSDAILARILPRAKAGDIIALHDGEEPGRTRSAAPTIAALPQLIKGLRDKGLDPVRLDELLGGTSTTCDVETARGSGSAAAGA